MNSSLKPNFSTSYILSMPATLTRLSTLQFGQLLGGRRSSFWDWARAMAGTGVTSSEEVELPTSEAIVRGILEVESSLKARGGQLFSSQDDISLVTTSD